ncbi:MAG: DUF4123 domain-containing protein [Bacteroidetes bacterium]|nr:DUF4123 domain-containing protein [Bacteroidota bacterium]
MFDHLNYTLLDAARMGDQLLLAKQLGPLHDSLYRGGKEASLSSVAPYIFQFQHGKSFANWLLKFGWGNAWGVLLKSSLPIFDLHKHFRKFLMVNTEEGKSLYFRYYDPRVLRLFLPTCNAAQLAEFFGKGIEYFIVEDEDPAYAIRFRLEGGALRQNRFEATALIEALPSPRLPKQELLPETIAALKEAGVLEQVLALMNGKPLEPPPPQPAAVMPDPLAAATMRVADEKKEQATKPKGKWNMFD